MRIGLGQGSAGELAGAAADGAEERALRIGRRPAPSALLSSSFSSFQSSSRAVRGGRQRVPTPAQPPAEPGGPSSNPPKTPIDGVTPSPKPGGAQTGSEPTQLTLGLTWSGEVPSQKWMNFYTKVLTKLGVGKDLSLSVKVKCNPQGGVSQQKIEEIKSALRELGLDDNFEE